MTAHGPFSPPSYEGAQLLIPFARPDTVLVTNVGVGRGIDAALAQAGYGQWLQAQGILAADLGRGNDELVHRALKDFGFEQLPFRQDVCAPVIEPVGSATTLRCRMTETAAEIVRHGDWVVQKVTAETFEALYFEVIWQKSGAPPAYIAGHKTLPTPKK